MTIDCSGNPADTRWQAYRLPDISSDTLHPENHYNPLFSYPLILQPEESFPSACNEYRHKEQGT